MYAKELLVVLIAVGLAASAAIQGVGKCKKGITGVSTFDFDTFSKENNGKWSYKLVPEDSDATEMWLESTPVEGGKYRVTVYKKVGNTAATVNSDQIREDLGGGHVKATAVKGTNKFDMYFIDYVQGKYACFVICSAEGAKSTDAVFVVANQALSQDEKNYLKDHVKNKGLTVSWKEI